MRGTLKDKEYFEERYAKDDLRFKRTQEDCKEALAKRDFEGKDYKGNIRGYYYDISIKFQQRFYTGYSLGVSKEELKQHLSTFIDAIVNSWHGTVYADLEFVLYYAIIFDISKNDMKPILDLLIEYDYQDYVLDSMAHYIDPDFIIRTEDLKFKKSSNAIAKIIRLAETNKEEAVLKLASFLQKGWLKLQTDGIIDNQSHLREDQYRGYWSIESAALVKMLNLNDDSLKDCKYYPYDLLH